MRGIHVVLETPARDLGMRPTYLNVGAYTGVRVQTLSVVNADAPLYSLFLKAVPAGFENRVRPYYPTFVNTATPSADKMVPDGAVRIMSSASVTIVFKEFGSSGAADSYTFAVAANTWYDVRGDIFAVSAPADIFFELDAL
jgi:hypothetical protein